MECVGREKENRATHACEFCPGILSARSGYPEVYEDISMRRQKSRRVNTLLPNEPLSRPGAQLAATYVGASASSLGVSARQIAEA